MLSAKAVGEIQTESERAKRKSRTKYMLLKFWHFLKILVTVVIVLVAAVVVGSHLNPALAAKAYFGAERAWTSHWPIEKGRFTVEKLVPVLYKAGVLQPVRMEVEPHISYLLNPVDVVPVTILRTGQWQPEVWSRSEERRV